MKTSLMKSILHLKDDTEYQIPLRETEKDGRAKVGAAATQLQSEQKSKKEQLEDNPTDKKKPNEISQEEVTDEEEATATQSQDDLTANKETDKVTDKGDSALDNLEEENPNPENSSNDTTTERVYPRQIQQKLHLMK